MIHETLSFVQVPADSRVHSITTTSLISFRNSKSIHAVVEW